jgi:hypothetical protein
MSADRGLRFFLAHADGQVDVIEISAAVSAAMDILLDDRVPEERAAALAVAAERSGRDPEAFARHFVELRQAWRGAPLGVSE